MVTGRTKEVSYIEAKRTRVPDFREVVSNLVRLARIHDPAAGQNNELVKEGDYIAARLVNREDDCAVIVACERNQAVDDTKSIVGVQPYTVL